MSGYLTDLNNLGLRLISQIFIHLKLVFSKVLREHFYDYF